METHPETLSRDGVSAEETKRMAQTFVEVYQVTLIRIEQHLEDIIEDAGEQYAHGYLPWHEALHDLLNGTVLIAGEVQPADRDSFVEALRLFSFDSSARFLHDLCSSVGIRTDRGWNEKFRAHIDMLMSSLDIKKYNPAGI